MDSVNEGPSIRKVRTILRIGLTGTLFYFLVTNEYTFDARSGLYSHTNTIERIIISLIMGIVMGWLIPWIANAYPNVWLFKWKIRKP